MSLPSPRGGVVARISDVLTTVTFEAGLEALSLSKETVAGGMKLAPVIVTDVPPFLLP